MNILAQKDGIAIRRMCDDIHDYQLMAKWLTDEKVLEFYEGRDNPHPLARIIEEYRPEVLGQDTVVPCIFVYHNLPIGYLQYCLLTEADKQNFGVEESGNIYGIDLFIGETNYWNLGIGTKVLSIAVNYLFEQLQAVMVVIDPHVGNTRAIQCYEKCGFVKVKLLTEYELHEGRYRDNWLMVIDRNKSVN